jgi:hypothetical protein
LGPSFCKANLNGTTMQISGDSLEVEIEITAVGPSTLLISRAALLTGSREQLTIS